MNCKGWANEKTHVLQYRTIKKNFLSNYVKCEAVFNRFFTVLITTYRNIFTTI